MDVFRELILRGDEARLVAVIAEIERAVPKDWFRDKVIEERTQRVSRHPRPIYCFACAKTDLRPGAHVFLTDTASGVLQVSNIIPHTQHQLEPGQYNAILEEFCERLVRPVALRMGVEVALTEAQADLERWLSKAAAEKLRAFSVCANKSTGAAHPKDRERWNDFVVAAHQDRSSLDASTLRRWLLEIENWPPEVADQLAREYAFGRELLAFDENHRRSA